MFPPVLAAVSIYRIVIEPDVIPSLEAWTAREGIEVRPDLKEALRTLAPKEESAAAPTPGSASPEDSSKIED